MKKILFYLFLCCFQFIPAQNKPLITNATKVDNLTIKRGFYSDCKYVEGFIFNQDYIIYQTCDSLFILHPDMLTFRVESYDYGMAIDKNGIYSQGVFFPIDTTNFKIVGFNIIDKKTTPIWRTNQKAFIGNKELAIPNPETFECIHYPYFKNKNNLYYITNGKVETITNADLPSIRTDLVTENYISDKNGTFYQAQPLMYKGERVQQLTKNILKTSQHVLYYDKEIIELPNYFHIPTLKALNESYLTDQNHAYYDDYYDYEKEIKVSKVPIPTKNLSKIKVFSHFITDGYTVYLGTEPQPQYNAATFTEFPENYYFQYDKNGVYNWNKKLPFKYSQTPIYGKNLFEVKYDAILYGNQVYDNIDEYLINNLTPKEIQLLKDGQISINDFSYLKGKRIIIEKSYAYNLYQFNNQIYIDKTPQKRVDAPTFQKLWYDIYKDKNNVYYYDTTIVTTPKLIPVNEYDAATLKALNHHYLLTDKNYLYFGRIRLIKSNKLEILAIYPGYRMGCSQDTESPTDFYIFKNIDGYWLAELGGRAKIRFLGTPDNTFKP